MVNYLSQGALLLSHLNYQGNTFFGLASPTLLVPLILLATLTNVLASQAVITGAFSVFKQLAELTFSHTSACTTPR